MVEACESTLSTDDGAGLESARSSVPAFRSEAGFSRSSEASSSSARKATSSTELVSAGWASVSATRAREERLHARSIAARRDRTPEKSAVLAYRSASENESSTTSPEAFITSAEVPSPLGLVPSHQKRASDVTLGTSRTAVAPAPTFEKAEGSASQRSSR